MAHPPILEAPNDFDPFALAEWLETTMLLEERSSMSRSDIRGRWASGQEPDQPEIELLFAEVRRRAELSTKPLELLTCEALKTQLGPASRALPFGWPSSVGRPKYLGDAVRWLADQLGLTTGPADVVPTSWTQWIRCGREPVVALSVPMAIPIDAKVRIKLRDRAGVLLDRHRLCELLNPRELSALAEMACIGAWVERETVEVRRFILERSERSPGIAKRRKPKKDAPGLPAADA